MLATTQAHRAALCDTTGRSWVGRRVVVIGLGRSGQGASQLLARAGCHVSVTEAHESPALRQAAEALRGVGVEAVELGQHSRRFMARSELVVVSPGVSDTAPPVQWAVDDGVPLISEIELAFQFCRAPVIAVTGTNGKSSVTTMIQDVLVASGRAAIACGNLGVPFASVIERLTPEAVAVVEISSFQLVRCGTFRPTIAVLLNVGTNHLDRHASHQDYLAAKARLFQRQRAEDWAVLNGRDPEIVSLGESLRAQRVWFGDNRTNPSAFRLAPTTLATLGENAQAVLQVGRILGIADPLIWQSIRGFRGLEHRLEYVTSIRGVSFINDSKSTTPESLLYAVQQIQGPLVLVLGGRDKALNFELLGGLGREPRLKGAVLIGESRQRLRTVLHGIPHVRESLSLEAALHDAAALAGPGDTVLFSPACASFDMFRNFEERGRAFKTLVQGMANSHSSVRTPSAQ